MVESVIREYLICPSCKQGAFEIVPFERDGNQLVHGVLACGVCRAWYRVEDHLPELLLPPLRNASRQRDFKTRFLSRWDGWSETGRAPCPASPTGDASKLEQIAFFRDQAQNYDRQILDSPFWNALDRSFLDTLKSECGKRGLIVEVGGGTGRYVLPLAREFGTVLNFDISEEMTREALRKFSSCSPRPGNVHYFVADAEDVPVRAGTADCVLFSGVLTYLSSPRSAIAEAIRVLAADGVVLGHENNRSAFRPCFDFLMMLNKCWIAKACPQRAAISRADLCSWLWSAGVTPHAWTAVFVPPHLLNYLPAGGAERLMRITNAVGGSLPWVRRQGGLLLFSGRRKSRSS